MELPSIKSLPFDLHRQHTWGEAPRFTIHQLDVKADTFLELAPGDLAAKHPKFLRYPEAGDHSLREIGRLAGVSAMTVKRVKKDLLAVA